MQFQPQIVKYVLVSCLNLCHSTPPGCTIVIICTDMCTLVGARRVERKKRKESYTYLPGPLVHADFLDKVSFNPHSNYITYTLSALHRLGNREINHITNRGGTLTSKLLGFFTVASCILMYGWEGWQLPQGHNEQQEKLR